MTRWTAEDIQRAQQRMNAPLVSFPRRNAVKPSKYKNGITIVDGISFHSKLEAKRYGELKLERAAKLIRYFLRQIAFDLPGGVRYFADFGIVENDGRIRYEDVKGIATPLSTLKIKQVEALYDITIELRS